MEDQTGKRFVFIESDTQKSYFEDLTHEEIIERLRLANEVAIAYGWLINADIGPQEKESQENLDAAYKAWLAKRLEDNMD